MSNITRDIIFRTRSSEGFGNKHLASDMRMRAKQRIFPWSKKLLNVSSAPRNLNKQLCGLRKSILLCEWTICVKYNRRYYFFAQGLRNALEINISQVTCRRERNKEFSLAKKQVKSAKRIIEPWIKLYIYKRRAFHRLNHWFISNRTGKIYFSSLAVTLQKTIRLTEWCRERKKIFACGKTS